jgi:hypothetical protein
MSLLLDTNKIHFWDEVVHNGGCGSGVTLRERSNNAESETLVTPAVMRVKMTMAATA